MLTSFDKYNQLIKACIKGERASQNKLYSLFASKMFVVCLRYAKNREEAEDILQEGFLKVFTSLQQYTYKGFFEGWLRKIIVNTALEKFQKNHRLYIITNIDELPDGKIATDGILDQLNVKEMINLIQQLPLMCRLVFNLYVFEGMKHGEIAELLNISEGTSKSNLFDARKILQKQISKNLNQIKQIV